MPRKIAIETKNLCGQRIRDERVGQGLTQTQFAARMELQGVLWDQKIVSRVELQLRAVMDYELEAAANVLGVSPNQLLYCEKCEER